jgi:phosphatidylglycerophosphate synthase
MCPSCPTRRRHSRRREPGFLTAVPERKLLRWIAARLPVWILPDDLTRLCVLAAFGVCAAYQLSNNDLAWLWAASGLLVVQWFGDSLDGTLARVRKIERPTYGYYIDHVVDAVATAASFRAASRPPRAEPARPGVKIPS